MGSEQWPVWRERGEPPVRGIDITFRFAGKAGYRAPDILGPAAWITRQEQRREHIAAHYHKQRPRECSHVLSSLFLSSSYNIRRISDVGFRISGDLQTVGVLAAKTPPTAARFG